MKEALRTTYNSIVYACLRAFFFWSRDIEFFPDANGRALTFRYKTAVYKCFSVSFLFHPTNTFAKFTSFHRDITARGIIEYIPSFRTSRFSIAYEYIPHARNLLQVLLEESVPEKRLEMFAKALVMIDYFHTNRIIHGDLKPKNILIAPDGQLNAIDFDNAFISDVVANRNIDYQKLIPRIIYLFTIDELRPLLAACSEPLRAFLEQYLQSFEIRSIIQSVPGLQFERSEDPTGEDIDLTVPDWRGLDDIRRRIENVPLDYRLFFRSRGDVKCYVYNLSGMCELDVHLVQPLSRAVFLREKTIRHPALQIAITGPDGVGKTALISGLIEHPQDRFLRQIPRGTLHASRFVREGSRTRTGPWTFADTIFTRLQWGLIGRVIAYKRLLRRNVTPILLLDRSFYDPYLQASTGVGYRLISVYRFLLPRDIRTILLHAAPATILTRKPQLSEIAIKRYYERATSSLPVFVTVNANTDSSIVQQQVETLLRFLALTEERLLP